MSVFYENEDLATWRLGDLAKTSLNELPRASRRVAVILVLGKNLCDLCGSSAPFERTFAPFLTTDTLKRIGDLATRRLGEEAIASNN